MAVECTLFGKKIMISFSIKQDGFALMIQLWRVLGGVGRWGGVGR